MYTLFCTISSFFNILTKTVFFDSFFLSKGKSQRIYYFILSILFEIVFLINTILNSGNYTSAKMLFTIILNISLSIILTLFYSSNTHVFHLLIPVVYETFAVLSEFITAVVLFSFHPELNSTNSLLQDSYITLISSIFMFLIVMLLRFSTEITTRYVSLFYF